MREQTVHGAEMYRGRLHVKKQTPIFGGCCDKHSYMTGGIQFYGR